MHKGKKQQILWIHGGEAFASRQDYLAFLRAYTADRSALVPRNSLRRNVQTIMGDDYEVLMPEMPCARNAVYAEWTIWLEKFLPFFEDGVIVVGHSLGGIFCAQYLAQHTFPVDIAALFLLAAPFVAEDAPERPLGDFVVPASLDNITAHIPHVFLYHSTDDAVVPVADVYAYARLLPQAEVMLFDDRGHFTDATFPELTNHFATYAS